MADLKNTLPQTSAQSGPNRPTGFRIYFAQLRGFKLVKIGRAINPAARIQSLQTGCPFEIVLLGSIPETDGCTERDVQARYDINYRCMGEWFFLGPEMCADLSSLGIRPADPEPGWQHYGESASSMYDLARAQPAPLVRRIRDHNERVWRLHEAN